VFWPRPERLRRVDLIALRVVASAPAQLGAAVEEIVRQRSQAVAVASDGMYFAERKKLQELVQTTRLPVAYALRDHVVAGGLLSYGADLPGNYRNAAKYVDRILKAPARGPSGGAAVEIRAGDQHEDREHTRLTIPQALLLRADEVIQ